MRLHDCYVGDNTPFEGDLTLWLRSLPSGAKATKATITLKPTPYNGAITLASPILGVTVVTGSSVTTGTTTNFVEVNFHARRTLVSVAGSGGSATLQVDMGGTYVSIADDGTIFVPAPGKHPFTVDFSTGGGDLPGLTVSKFRLSQSGGQLNVTSVSISSIATNVNVRLGQLPPFWVQTGEVATDTTSPDFTKVLNAFLATAQPQNGFYSIPFVIHSDTIAQMDVMAEIDYVIDQPVLPSYLPEINLPYAFNQLPDIDQSQAALTTVTLPREAMPVTGASTAKIIGQFQPTRVALNLTDDQPATASVLIAPDSSLAQQLPSGTEIEVTAIDLPLLNLSPDLAGLNIGIRDDNDGKPSSTVLASANVTVGKPLPDQSVWGSATLPKPFRTISDKKYWLVLQSQNGQANWKAVPGTPGQVPMQRSSDNGLSWRAANAVEALAPLSAQFRLRNTPARFSIPLQLQIGKSPGDVRRTLDEFAPLGRVELSFDFSGKLGEYLTGTVAKTASPCGNQDLVVNGDFADPAPDDASMKLFGIETKQAGPPFTSPVTLGPTVDLSVERFVTLSFDPYSSVVQPTRIDCAGRNPAQTTPGEILNAIQQKVGSSVVELPGQKLVLEGEAVLYPWCSNQIPSGWQGILDQTYRLKIPDGTNHVVTLLADPANLDLSFFINSWNISFACFPINSPSPSSNSTGEASLSQLLPVAAGCTYHLSISALIGQFDQPSAQTLPVWEVTWFGANGNTLRTDNEPITPLQVDSALLPSNVETLLVSPPNAVNAELRFTNSTPDAYALILEKVSFTPTLETLRNGSFLQWEGDPGNESPAGWTLLSGLLEAPHGINALPGVGLHGDSTEDTALSQIVNVVAGAYYALQVRALPVFPQTFDTKRPPIQQHARLELHWLGSTSPGDTVSLLLDGQTFIESDWAGTAPAGLTQAEIRLIQPKNSNQVNLLVESVTLTRTDRVPVPLTFLSETPGQLTVSNMHVVYEVPETPKPARPTPMTPMLAALGSDEGTGRMHADAPSDVESNASTGASGTQFIAAPDTGLGAAATGAVTTPSGAPMENTKIRMLLKTIAKESSTLRLLRDDPQRIQQRFNLSDEELNALRSADLLRAGEPQMQQGNGGIQVPARQAVEVLEANGTGTIVPPSFINGLDVSHHDGVIDWSAVPSQGYAFAYTKATEGIGHTDTKFARNWAGMKQNNLLRGAYHFFRSNMDPIKQANHFLKVVPSLQPGDLPPVLDLESTDKMSGTAILDATEQWLIHVEQALGRTPIIYSSARFWRENLANANNPNRFSAHYPIWVAYYRPAIQPPLPDGWTRWTFWQYTDKGMVTGVPGDRGHVDLNRFNGSLADLRVLAGL